LRRHNALDVEDDAISTKITTAAEARAGGGDPVR
jgi:hypothetical protein